MSGATHEVGAPEPRIVVPMELVLTPRGNRLILGTWTRGHRSQPAYSSVVWHVNPGPLGRPVVLQEDGPWGCLTPAAAGGLRA
jgi:hypothetical protein